MEQEDYETISAINQSLNGIKPEIKEMATRIAKSNTFDSLSKSFNDKAVAFLDAIAKMNEIYKGQLPVNSYITIFKDVLKMNYLLPIEGASSTILIYTDRIYNRDESFFMQMDIKDVQITGKSNFAFLRSAEFKRIWSLMSREHKDTLINELIRMTSFVYSYYIKKVFKY